jgi:hypothetical protein
MRQLLATAVVATLATAVIAASASQVKVQPIVTEGHVKASFIAVDFWTIETRETLQLGTLITFDYYVELRRPSALWIDPVLAETNVRAEAKLDTLTGKYQVSRVRDGRVDRVEKRDQENEVRDWLTVFEPIELQLNSPLKANTDYYIQVRLLKNPRRSVSLWSLMPFGSDDGSGRAAFTYLR